MSIKRNPGQPYDRALIEAIRVNRSALERRAATMGTRRSVKKDWQAAWLLRAIGLIDLTTLAGDDTPARVRRLCMKAKNPIRRDILEKLGVGDLQLHTAAVCVYHNFVKTALEALAGSGIPVAAVSTGFPAGHTPLTTRLSEIKASVRDGAREIDIVIERHMAIREDWYGLYRFVRKCREACGEAHLKVILGTGELGTLRRVAQASMVAMMAGADFIKTSTGKEKVNATLPVSLAMVRQIRAYQEMTGFRIGYKPAGGISDAKTALTYMILMKEELGQGWLRPELFRFGASSLLGDLERQLEHCATGRYSARHHHALV
ncbi:MAG TPA: deoxyribose-phosphate aldolase [Hellea balneolensis]|uniref:Deoxyribose-phosphate aldolase n=1 Tax=Hellea balneolensis TaxID=287478 RepID=A0A7V5U0S4_9PROT|nr:deoxyribose-phosphate aldolase [Hellea balneolensis]